MAEETKKIGEIGEISEADVAALRRMTALMLPDSPAAAGMPAEAVKKYFYQWLIDNKQSIVALINRIVGEINGELVPLGADTKQLKSDVSSLEEGKLDKITEKDGAPVKQAAYVMGDSGEPTLLPYTRKSDRYTLMRRDNQGNAHVKKPTETHDEHIVNVKMLREKVDTLESKIEESVENIPNATSTKPGVMTPEQVYRLDYLYNLLTENADKQINKINEVFSALKGFDEEFVLLEALNSKLNKRTEPDSNARLYGVDKNGTQMAYKHSSANIAYAVISRDGSGRAKVADPDDDYHIANKQFVERVAGSKVNVIELEQDSVDESRWYYPLKGYNFYIITAHCKFYDDGVFSECNTATWIVPNSLLSEESYVTRFHRFPPYRFMSVNDDGEEEEHTLSCSVETLYPESIVSVSCTCRGADVKIIVEGVK